MLRAKGVIAGIRAENARIGGGECVIEGKLDRRGEGAAVFA